MSLQSHIDRDSNPPCGGLFLYHGWYGAQFPNIEKLFDLDNLTGMWIEIANHVCNRTAPVFLVPDSWQHWLTSPIFLEELLLYTHKRWFRPYESDIDRGQFLTKVCTLPQSPASPTEACSQEMADYIKMWSANLCARVALAQSDTLDHEERRAGKRLYHMRPLFRAVAVAVAIRFTSFSVTVTDISTIPVLIVRTGVEDGLSAPVDLEQVPESDRRAVVAGSQGRLSAVEATLDVTITFLMALEQREETDGPVTKAVIQGTRVMDPTFDISASRREKLGWDEEQMGPLMGPSSTWVDATKRPVWSGKGYETVQDYREMCAQRREDAKPIMREMQDAESWRRYMRETSSR